MTKKLLNPKHALISLLAVCLFMCAQIQGAKASEQGFLMPVDCTLGETCWIVNYVDVDESDGYKDFQCGPRSYDTHKGTDFAVKSEAVMMEGINVLAAMDGTVLRHRDGMDDTPKSRADIAKITERNLDCGNAAIIKHDNGYETQYCHMKRGSVRVQDGQKVKAGDVIGQIGQSGRTEFPHLHITIRKDGIPLDPFTGLPQSAGCGKAGTSLWDQTQEQVPTYTPLAIYDGGFQAGPVDFKAVSRGEHNPTRLSKNSPALVLWTAIFGVREGDILDLQILAPQGKVFMSYSQKIERTQAQYFYNIGRRLKGRALPVGTYRGIVEVTREGHAPFKKIFRVDIL